MEQPVSHLEKVPRHVVSWELAKPTLTKLPNLFLQCFLFLSRQHSKSKHETFLETNTVLENHSAVQAV